MVQTSVSFCCRCYSFADMPWYQRKIAATLFATPPTSTFQEVQYENVSQMKYCPHKATNTLLLIFFPDKTDISLWNKHGLVSLYSCLC